jgi:hypothetical protein
MFSGKTSKPYWLCGVYSCSARGISTNIDILFEVETEEVQTTPFDRLRTGFDKLRVNGPE